MDAPYAKANDLLNKLIKFNSTYYVDYSLAIANITLNEFSSYVKEFRNEAYLSMLVNGYFNEENLKSLEKTVKDTIRNSKSHTQNSLGDVLSSLVATRKLDGLYDISLNNEGEDFLNNAVVTTYQVLN